MKNSANQNDTDLVELGPDLGSLPRKQCDDGKHRFEQVRTVLCGGLLAGAYTTLHGLRAAVAPLCSSELSLGLGSARSAPAELSLAWVWAWAPLAQPPPS